LLLEDLRFLAQQTHIDGLDLYELIQFPNSPLARAVAEGRAGIGEPPDRAGRARMFAAAAEALAGHGFEHFTPQHWRRGTRERSVYNRLAKSNADILPIGSSAGGNLSRVSIMMERDIDAYAAQIHAGTIPARCLAPTGPISEVERFKTTLAEAAERLSVPSPARWPQEARGWAASLLENWTQAGLLEAPAPEEGEAALKMTPAGAYWAKVMQRLIMACLSPTSPGSGHPGTGHPHGGVTSSHGHSGGSASMPGHPGGHAPQGSGHHGSHPGEAGGGHPRDCARTLVR
jgi:oxygen-independent coproporphyrinogen-3 oxidase